MRRRFTDSSEKKGTGTEEGSSSLSNETFFSAFFAERLERWQLAGCILALCRYSVVFFHREIIVSRGCRNFLAANVDVGRLDVP